jgi:hypothetical protein
MSFLRVAIAGAGRRCLVVRPEGCHVLVGDSTEAEQVGLVELADGEVVERLVDDRPSISPLGAS